MRQGRLAIVACLVAVFGVAGRAGHAMPGEMPWDHAGGPGQPDCTACHFDAKPVTQSPSLRLDGLPEKAVSGKTYDLVLRLETDTLKTAGFLMRAISGRKDGTGGPAGEFRPSNGMTEAGEGAIRSTRAGTRQEKPGLGKWQFSWQAPKNLSGAVHLYLAAVAGNDDQSPLGDRVHLRRIDVMVSPDER